MMLAVYYLLIRANRLVNFAFAAAVVIAVSVKLNHYDFLMAVSNDKKTLYTVLLVYFMHYVTTVGVET